MLSTIRSALLAAALVLPAAAVPAAAQPADPAALEAAEELFEIISADVVDQMVGPAVEQIWPQFDAVLPSQVDAATRDLLRAEIEAFMRELVDETLEEGPAIYARHFTAEELTDLADFYQTPLGMRLLDELPQITTEINAMLVGRLEEISLDLQARLTAILRERGFDL